MWTNSDAHYQQMEENEDSKTLDPKGPSYNSDDQDTGDKYTLSGVHSLHSISETKEHIQGRGMRRSSPSHEEDAMMGLMQRIRMLEKLRDEGMLTDEDFENRKAQLIDKITNTSGASKRREENRVVSGETVSTVESWIGPIGGTQSSTGTGTASRRKQPLPTEQPSIIPHPPPQSWAHIQKETAIMHSYDHINKKWLKKKIRVQLDNVPFAKGNLRFCCHLKIDGDKDKDQTYVAKMSSNPRDTIERSIYFRDCRMQEIARHYAEEYNKYKPPKLCKFLQTWVLQLMDREFEPLCSLEMYLTGKYQKYSNNYYYADVERNTPHAFAHFSFEASGRQLIICDIQGVQDIYTDPQVHNQSGEGFGRGNLGQAGFQGFLQTHRCNAICKYLKLPNISQLPIEQVGTMPAQTRMPYEIKNVNVGVGQSNTLLPSDHYVQRNTSEDSGAFFCPCTLL